jgi:hypothetical protein
MVQIGISGTVCSYRSSERSRLDRHIRIVHPTRVKDDPGPGDDEGDEDYGADSLDVDGASTLEA